MLKFIRQPKPRNTWLGQDIPPSPTSCEYVHAHGLDLASRLKPARVLRPRYAADVYGCRFTGHTLHEVHSKIAAFEQSYRPNERLHSYLIQDI